MEDIKPVIASRTTVLGGGAFGTAMANHLGMKGSRVRMWVMEADAIRDINTNHRNDAFLKDVQLDKNVTATSSVEEAVMDTELLLLVIPTPFIASWVVKHQTLLPANVPIVCCSKGIDERTLRTPYEILVDELPGKYHAQLCAVSGPSFAKEVAAGLPTNVTCAATTREVGVRVQAMLSSRTFRVYTASDLIGAELCGAIKNVLAIACGASDGFGFGADARAALITRGLAEMARLVVQRGGKVSTVTGLAGVGDLVLTCSSSLSRNYSVGKAIAEGKGMDTGAAVAEGVRTSLAMKRLAEKLDVDMPICDAVYQVIHNEVPIQRALAGLQARPLRSEDDDVIGGRGGGPSSKL